MPSYGTFWGVCDSTTRYMSHVAYGLQEMGHDVTCYVDIVVPGDMLNLRHTNRFDPLEMDILLTGAGKANEITRNMPIYIPEAVVTVELEYPQISPAFADGINGFVVPSYVPPIPISLPFVDRRHRIFIASPTEVTYDYWQHFHHPIDRLRADSYFHIVTHNRNNRVYELKMDMGIHERYAAHMFVRYDNYIHTWMNWKEYLFIIATSGIFCRYNWYSDKLSVPEALAYGCIPIFTGDHSYYYDTEDVTLISEDQPEEAIYQLLHSILTDSQYEDKSRFLADKYSARHSIGEVKRALEEIPF